MVISRALSECRALKNEENKRRRKNTRLSKIIRVVHTDEAKKKENYNAAIVIAVNIIDKNKSFSLRTTTSSKRERNE